MNVGGAFDSGLQGIFRAEEGLSRNANTIAKASAGSKRNEDVNTALVQAKENQIQAQASANVVRTANDVMGTLLDTKA